MSAELPFEDWELEVYRQLGKAAAVNELRWLATLDAERERRTRSDNELRRLQNLLREAQSASDSGASR